MEDRHTVAIIAAIIASAHAPAGRIPSEQEIYRAVDTARTFLEKATERTKT